METVLNPQNTRDRMTYSPDATGRPDRGAAGAAGRTAPRSGKKIWTGRILSGLAVAFLLFDSLSKVAQAEAVMKASAQLGFPAGAIRPIGFVLLACTVVYLIPRTAVLGAILLTGYLGGAVEANVQVGNPLVSHTLFPIYFAALVWGGLYLRDGRVRGCLAAKNTSKKAG